MEPCYLWCVTHDSWIILDTCDPETCETEWRTAYE